MDYELVEFVAFIEPDEETIELVAEVKGLTFVQYREFALLMTDAARLVLVRGGRLGILFELDADGNMIVETPEGRRRISRLLWHTHPIATGPSDHDRGVLRLLGQQQSCVYEINGPAGGTMFGRQRGES